MSQTDYNLDMKAGFLGALVDQRSSTIEGGKHAEAAIGFGKGVVKGAEGGLLVASEDSDVFRGVAVRTDAMENSLETLENAEYEESRAVNLLRKGIVWVRVTAAVEEDEAAFVDITTEGEEGDFTSDADDGDSNDNLAVPSGVFRSAAGAGELAQLEINLPT